MPARRRKPTDAEIEADRTAFANTAKRLGLKGEAAEKYVHKHMIGLGLRAKPCYVASDDNDNDDGGENGDDDWF